MEGYEIKELDKGLWAIDDDTGCSLYLIEGTEKALLIDTGIREGKLMPMLRKLTDKPIELALTHAHIDHMYHADEFDTVYLQKKDIKAWYGPIGLCMWLGAKIFNVHRKSYSIKKYVPIDGGTVLDLGEVKIRVVSSPGHTPGSVTYVDESHKVLFMGDAVGSGAEAWLWLPGSFSVNSYKNELTELIKKLEPYRNYEFLGGHRQHGVQTNENPHTHTLTIRVIEDMEKLCEKMLSGEVKLDVKTKVGPFTLNTYRYGHASMVQRKSKIR